MNAASLLAALAWIGGRARWFLAVGVVGALILPGPGSLLSGTLPVWVALLLCLAMARIDLGDVLRRAVRPRRLATNIVFLALLMGVTPAVLLIAARTLGAAEAHVEALVYTAVAPPLGSAAAFCLILGLDAAFALELTVLGAFIAPVTMPILSRLLLGNAVPLEMGEMFLRLSILIGAAVIGAVLVRRTLGAGRIQDHRLSFDGFASICLIMFLFPLFDGIGARILAAPMIAAATLLVAVLANTGVQILTLPVTRRIWGRETGGSAALIWGNRNAALALASLPSDPMFTLYVALYQFPMYFTPLVLRPFLGERPGEIRRKS